MQKLVIQYKDSEGNISERLISEYAPRDFLSINAYCHTRNAIRTFVVNRIISIADADTGEVIEDKYACFGFSSIPKVDTIKPKVAISINETFEEIRKRRNKEKYELFKTYRLEIIKDFYKRKLLALFDDRCFKCGYTENLVIDHNIPMAFGGRFIPGNLVMLCVRCNDAKGTLIPERFYNQEELFRLESLLGKEPETMGFYFEWVEWNKNPKQYLASIGIEKELIEEAFNNPHSRFYIRPSS